jgi:DNA polymerase
MNMPIVWWDLETRSAVNLRDAGSYVYAIDPTTELLCLSYAIDDGEPQLVLPTADCAPTVFFEIAADPKEWQLVAHNYDFERNIYDNVLVER